MRKIEPQRLFNGLITWINWMPKLILLLWLVCSLPFFTVATATRSMIAAIKQIKDTQERAEQEKTTTIFFTKFSELWQLNKKKDIVFSFYSLFLLIDHSILSRFPQPLFQVMATMLIVIFMICSLIVFWLLRSGVLIFGGNEWLLFDSVNYLSCFDYFNPDLSLKRVDIS